MEYSDSFQASNIGFLFIHATPHNTTQRHMPPTTTTKRRKKYNFFDCTVINFFDTFNFGVPSSPPVFWSNQHRWKRSRSAFTYFIVFCVITFDHGSSKNDLFSASYLFHLCLFDTVNLSKIPQSGFEPRFLDVGSWTLSHLNVAFLGIGIVWVSCYLTNFLNIQFWFHMHIASTFGWLRQCRLLMS